MEAAANTVSSTGSAFAEEAAEDVEDAEDAEEGAALLPQAARDSAMHRVRSRANVLFMI
jgi:hypothetical protein